MYKCGMYKNVVKRFKGCPFAPCVPAILYKYSLICIYLTADEECYILCSLYRIVVFKFSFMMREVNIKTSRHYHIMITGMKSQESSKRNKVATKKSSEWMNMALHSNVLSILY